MVHRHYAALQASDLDTLREIHGRGIVWPEESESISYEMVEMKIVGDPPDSERAYIRVKQEYENRVEYMNFAISRRRDSCRIDNFNSDEPRALTPADLDAFRTE